MVARIRTGKSMLGALNYNESKVRNGDAVCVAANMFGADVNELTFEAKRQRFAEAISRNRKSKTNVVHISLNFAVEEKIDKSTLSRIADAYMEKIGFSSQPYLVYQHFDSGHPHLHILSTSIQDNGKRIQLHDIGRIRSEKARKEIEEDFSLIKAEGKKQFLNSVLDPKQLQKALYGKAETGKTISRIVNTISRKYKYTSLPELNAVLGQYNVMADRGKEESVMFTKKGLQYSLLDGKGNKVGVPIKASRIIGKPTLKNLEKQFKLNEALRGPLKKRLQDKIDLVFSYGSHPRLRDFVKALQDENIITVFRQNDQGRIYGLTFIDQQQRVVFNGSDLGKQYGAKAIIERLTETAVPKTGQINPVKENSKPSVPETSLVTGAYSESSMLNPIKDLITAEENRQGVDPSLMRKRRKKRKGRSL
jgi:hypothetical protein